MGTNEWLLVIFLLIGLGGTILPMVPGLGLMFLALLVYSYFDGWQTFAPWYVLLAALAAIVGAGIGELSSALGAKRFGVSRQGFWGALAGGLLGGLFFQLVGLVAGAMVGTVAVELYQRRSWRESLSAAAGVLAGSAVGMALQLALGLVVVVCSILQLLW